MSANSRHQYDGVLGMAKGASSRQVVSCRSSRRGNADAVGLHGGEVLVIAEEFDRGHC